MLAAETRRKRDSSGAQTVLSPTKAGGAGSSFTLSDRVVKSHPHASSARISGIADRLRFRLKCLLAELEL